MNQRSKKPPRATTAASSRSVVIDVDTQPPVLLDANVLLPQYLRAIFLDLADADLLRVHWSAQILAEVRRNLVDERGPFGLAVPQADRLLAAMAAAFPNAVVSAGGGFGSRFRGTVDVADIHVAEAAMRLKNRYRDRTTFLVTSNIRHLPQAAFPGPRLVVVTPDALLCGLLVARPRVAVVLDVMIHRFRRPSVSQEDFLEILHALHCRRFAVALGDVWALKYGASLR